MMSKYISPRSIRLAQCSMMPRRQAQVSTTPELNQWVGHDGHLGLGEDEGHLELAVGRNPEKGEYGVEAWNRPGVLYQVIVTS